MNDTQGNPVYPRHPSGHPPGWTGIFCVRLIPKAEPAHIYAYSGQHTGIVTDEVCRGDIVERDGHIRCSHCKATPSWA